MRFLFATAAILLLTCAASFGQERNLQLTTNILSQQACAINASLDALQLTMQLRYTNVGSQKLILYKGNRLFYQVFISRSLEETAARKFELRTSHSRFYDEQPERIEAASPGSVFTILSPGASYETKQVVIIPVARDGAGRINVSLAAGEHLLQLAASTWYESKKLADNLRERWRARGFLWTEPLASNSIGLVVDPQRAATVCR